jgi:peptide/nickel transport system permease protein
LLFISLVIFLLLELAPGDPMAQVPLTVPPEVKQKMREALGLGEPMPSASGNGSSSSSGSNRWS